MRNNYQGIVFECSTQEDNGEYWGLCSFIFHNDQYTYIVKKMMQEKFSTQKEAEIKAMEFAKNYIELGPIRG